MQGWHEDYSDRGLAVWGVWITASFDEAQAYWEGDLGGTHAWASDILFSTGTLADCNDDGIVGTPAYVIVDLENMEIANCQEGYSGFEENLFTPYLR